MAKGVSTKAERTVTIKDPANIGKAPTAGFPSGPIAPGSQCVPKRKRNGFTPSTKKVERPFRVYDKNDNCDTQECQCPTKFFQARIF